MDMDTYLLMLKRMHDLEPEIVSAVNDWLDEHPEATTTVQDGAITRQKMNSDFLNGIVTYTNGGIYINL